MSLPTPIRSLPKTDAELEKFISQMQASLGKYFGLNVSPSRSNKMRDCICEGLGYTNGAYQEFKAESAGQHSASGYSIKCSFISENFSCDGYFSMSIFGTEDSDKIKRLINNVARDTGVEGLAASNYVEFQKSKMSATQIKTYNHPVLLNGEFVGYAKSASDAAMFAGLFLAARMDFDAPFVVESGDEQRDYIFLSSSYDDDLGDKRCSGLKLEFKTIEIQFNHKKHHDLCFIVETYDYGTLLIQKNQDEAYSFNGMLFNSLILKSSTYGPNLAVEGNIPSYSMSAYDYKPFRIYMPPINENAALVESPDKPVTHGKRLYGRIHFSLHKDGVNICCLVADEQYCGFILSTREPKIKIVSM